MKKTLRGAVVVVALLAAAATEVWAQPPDAPPPSPANTVGGFYNDLAPYGRWVYSADYGWMWVPSPSVVGAGFVPYGTNGQWVHSDAGWMFESGYPWGWITFHYGRWDYGSLGWAWIPGYVWGPAWVDWRYGAGYVGWAPLMPPWRQGRRDHWVFVHARDFTSRRLGHRFVSRVDARRAYLRSRPARGVVVRGGRRWYHGPPVASVRRHVRGPVTTVRVRPPARGVVARVRIRGNRAVVNPRYRQPSRYRRPPAARRGYRPPAVRRGTQRGPARPSYRGTRRGPAGPSYRGPRRGPTGPSYRGTPGRRGHSGARQAPSRRGHTAPGSRGGRGGGPSRGGSRGGGHRRR